MVTATKVTSAHSAIPQAKPIRHRTQDFLENRPDWPRAILQREGIMRWIAENRQYQFRTTGSREVMSRRGRVAMPAGPRLRKGARSIDQLSGTRNPVAANE